MNFMRKICTHKCLQTFTNLFISVYENYRYNYKMIDTEKLTENINRRPSTTQTSQKGTGNSNTYYTQDITIII